MIERGSFEVDGFSLLPGVFPNDACARIVAILNGAGDAPGIRRRGSDLYAVRHVLSLLPQLRPLVLTDDLTNRVADVMGRPVWLTERELTPRAERGPSQVTKSTFQAPKRVPPQGSIERLRRV